MTLSFSSVCCLFFILCPFIEKLETVNHICKSFDLLCLERFRIAFHSLRHKMTRHRNTNDFGFNAGSPSLPVTIRKEHLTPLLTRVQTYYSLYLVSTVACISSESLILFSNNLQEAEKNNYFFS